MKYRRSRLEMIYDVLLVIAKHGELSMYKALSYAGLRQTKDRKRLIEDLVEAGVLSKRLGMGQPYRSSPGIQISLTDKGKATLEDLKQFFYDLKSFSS